MEGNILLSSAYFAPVHFYSRLIAHSRVFIEKFENFNKQTYRNRAVILGGNGTVPLIVPVVKGRGTKIQIKDLKISYEMNWQRNQWNTIVSAYNSSPYFEFYKDDIQPFFEKKTKYLFDLNILVNENICELLEIDKEIEFTTDFNDVPPDTLNLCNVISPKNKTIHDPLFKPKEYTQVFSDRFGFVPNLSILDLLFNEGPNSLTILEQSIAE